MTKPGAKTILLVSLLIAAGLWYLLPRKSTQPVVTSSVFVTDKGWGYDIRINDSLLIRQDVIPALPVNYGFASKQQAQAAAALVVKKLRHKEYPALSADEIQQLMTAAPHE